MPHLVTVNDPIEASTITSLHAQDASIHNIQSLVPITLSVQSTQYSHWWYLVRLTLQHFTLADHITVGTAPSATPTWLLDSLTVDL
jgi:hypothetical protein